MIGRESRTIGQPNLGLERDVVASVLDITTSAWPLARASTWLNADSSETAFAGALVEHMREIKERRGLQLIIDEEVGTRHEGAHQPTGRIDIKVHYDFREHTFLGIECKRVSAGQQRLANLYASEGVMRFVSGKYSPGHAHGLMFAFAIDGDCLGSARLVAATVGAWPEAAILKGWDEAAGLGRIPGLYHTRHNQTGSGKPIALLHLFLPFFTQLDQ